MLAGDNRLLGGVHAADRGAIVPAAGLVPGADALNPGYLYRVPAVGRTLHLALERAGGGKDTLKLQAGHHVGHPAVAILALDGGVKRLKAGSQHHRTDLQFDFFFFHFVVNGFGLADGHALETLAAEAAVQASLGFSHGFLFGKGGVHLVKAGDSFLQRYSLNADPWLFLVLAGGQRRRLFFFRLPPFPEVGLIKIALDGNGGFMPVLDSFHRRLRPGNAIAAGKDAGLVGGQCHRVNDEKTAPGGLDTGFFRQHRQVGGLPDGDNHGVPINRGSNFFIEGGTKPPFAVEHRGALFKFNGGYPPVFVDYLPRAPRVLYPDALFFRFLYLPGVGRHFLGGLQADGGNLGRPQPPRRPGDVHSHVAAADDHHPVAQADFFTLVNVPQEVERQQHLWPVNAGDGQAATQLRPDGQVNRLIALFLQGVKGGLAVNRGIELELYPGINNILDVLGQHVLGETVLGNGRMKLAARLRACLKNRHGIAQLDQVMGAGQPGRPGAHHSDLWL